MTEPIETVLGRAAMEYVAFTTDDNLRECEFGKHVTDALAAAGLQVVPKEPSRSMLDAAYTAIKRDGDDKKGVLSRRNLMRARYRAMLESIL
jgi:alcohol dehydrogenase class IV